MNTVTIPTTAAASPDEAAASPARGIKNRTGHRHVHRPEPQSAGDTQPASGTASPGAAVGVDGDQLYTGRHRRLEPQSEPTHRWVLRSTKVTLHVTLLAMIFVVGLALVAVICIVLLLLTPAVSLGSVVKRLASHH